MRTHGRSQFARIFRVTGHEPNASGSSDSEVLLFHPRRVRFWARGADASSLLIGSCRPKSGSIDRSARPYGSSRDAAPPLAPMNKMSEDELEECQGRNIATFIR
ncbi:unnamed protein product [Sphagnum jensenii]|uniref:Uncharacterized protein n=1 Tax=Sphagnum jensenii TaxID=128206 RepID=A0ABP1B5B2_9BRYO